MERAFPLTLQESYDNSGSQILFPDSDISSILISLDMSSEVLNEARDSSCNLIITHHPLFFQPLSRIDASEPISQMIIKLIERKISIYSVHTNLDKIFHKKLSLYLGFMNASLLIEKEILDGQPVGYGSISILKNEISAEALLFLLKDKLKIDFILYAGDRSRKITSIAFLNGAGGKSIEKIIKNNHVDCIVTGDIGYHDAKFAMDYPVMLIDAGHFSTERVLLDFLSSQLHEYISTIHSFENIRILKSVKEKNPFNLYC